AEEDGFVGVENGTTRMLEWAKLASFMHAPGMPVWAEDAVLTSLRRYARFCDFTPFLPHGRCQQRGGRAPRAESVSLVSDRDPLYLDDAIVPQADQEELLSKYQFFPMDSYVFQVPKDEEGRLDLAGTVMLHRGTGEKGPPEVLGRLPEAPTRFRDLPWDSEFLGNKLEKQAPQTWVWATYLVGFAAGDAPGLDLGCVYRLDGMRGRIEQCRVQRFAAPDTPPRQLLLRIRRDGAVILDTKVSAPTPVEIVEAHLAGLVMPSRLEVMHGGVPVSETWFDPSLAAAMAEMEDTDPSLKDHIVPGENPEYDDDSMRDFMTEFDDEMDDDVDDFDSPAIDM
ncbi:hypothetical protein APUTEX25_001472, partial [Auxenochlorella protothecoides]